MTWETVPLQYVAEIDPSKAPLRALPDDTPVDFLPMEAVGYGTVFKPSETRPLGEVWDGYTYVRDGDVAFAKISPSFQNGKGGRATGLTNGIAFATTELTVLRPLTVDTRFLQYVLRSDAFVRTGAETLHGVAGQQRVSSEFVQSFPVPMPPWEVQQRIADYLDTETARIDTLILANKRAAQLVEERLSSARENIVDGPRVALNYALRSLKQGSSPVADAYSSAGSGQEGVLKLSAIRRGRFDPSENKLLIDGSDGLLRVRAGQILISRANTPDLVGDVAHVVDTLDADLYTPDLMFVLTIDERVADPGFVTEALLTSESRAQMSGLARGSSQSMVKLRQDDVRALRICLPARDAQERKVGRIRELRTETTRLLDRMRLQHELLRERRRALITAALTGELEV